MIYLILIILLITIYFAYSFKVPNDLKGIPRISALEILRSVLKGNLLHEHYNQVIAPHLKERGYAVTWTLGNWGFITKNPEIIKQLFRNNSQFIKTPIKNPHSLFARFLGQKSILTSNGEEWRRFRRPANPIFHQSFQPEIFVECVAQTLDAFSDRIHQCNGQPIPVTDLMELMTLDVLGKGIFSHDFEAVKSMGTSKYHSLYSSIMKEFANAIFFFFPILERLPFGKRAKVHTKVTEFNEIIKGLINQRRNDMQSNQFMDSSDLLSTLLTVDPDSPYEPLTDEELVHNLNVFFVAGHDTTANTLSFAMYHLARNPEIQDKLRKEIYETLNIPKDQEKIVAPTSDQLKKMEFLGLFIKEVMRVSPAVSQISRTVDEDYTIPGDNVLIRKGTVIQLSIYGAQHDPTIYPNPEKFDPERFLNGRYDTDVYLPFGGGSRICLGINFSLMEQKVFLTMFLQKFLIDIHQDNPDYQKLRITAFGLNKAKDLHLNLRPRF